MREARADGILLIADHASAFVPGDVELGIAPPTKSITTQVVKAFESFLKDTLSEYDVKFIEKSKAMAEAADAFSEAFMGITGERKNA